MAKGSLLGVLRGKLGNMVGYNVTNSSDAVKQGWRNYQPTVKNPRTIGQAAQRMRIANATKFYRAFGDILDHSWEGIEYGGKSMQRFMARAMRADGPYVYKGYPGGWIPGMYEMSSGSLPTINIQVIDRQVGSVDTMDIMLDSDYATNASWGTTSGIILRDNPSLQDGDQLTLVYAQVVNGTMLAKWVRLVLDTNSDEVTSTVYANAGLGITRNQIDGNAVLTLAPNSAQRPIIDGAAIILSRKSGSTWLRSSSTMTVTQPIIDLWFSDEAFRRAIATYQSASSTTTLVSPRILNRAGIQETAVARLVALPVEWVTAEDGWTPPASNLVLAAIGQTGDTLLFVSDEDELIALDGSIIPGSTGGVHRTTGGLPAIEIAYNSSYGTL